VVAPPRDPHAEVIQRLLHQSGVLSARTSLADWSNHGIAWTSPDEMLMTIEGEDVVIDSSTTVWWRRPGWFENAILEDDELALARDEAAIIFPGALDAAAVRWVDGPWVTTRSGNRLVQLRTAHAIGARVPDSLATNSTGAAKSFIQDGVTLAKTISTGPGLAPFVDRVEDGDMALVRSAPVLLQRVIDARADWRIVTVGESSVGWRRPRVDQSHLDWRVDDPEGSQFIQAAIPGAWAELANAIRLALGLSFSVQDWLEVDDEPWVFLEVNPQGQWLFLEHAASSVGPLLASHLGQAPSE
jgi:hypothetical protein